jgi:EmrB/QacA subfamily drug resistance transporter
MIESHSSRPVGEVRGILVLLCVSVPAFMIGIDSNIVAVSLPSIARSLRADFSAIEWVISAYTLTFASLLLPAGALADRYGRKQMLVLGLTVFSLASFLCGATPNLLVLNAARALQGVGAALQLSAALAILSHQFHGPIRTRAFAFWGSVVGVAITLGPVTGGFITEQFGWQWAFYINIPVGAAMIALTMISVEESRDPHVRRIDFLGALAFSSALFLVTLALIEGNHYGWSSRTIQLEFLSTVALFVLFAVAENTQERPMLDLTFFRNPTYLGANIAGLAFASCLLTMLTYLPIYFQNGLQRTPQAAGFLMLPMVIPLFVVPRIVVAHLSHRVSSRVLLALGLAVVSGGLFWMGMEAPRFDYSAMLGGMLVTGLGAGMLNGEVVKVGMSVVPSERAGMASGISGTVRFSGIAVGFAVLGAILFARISSTVMTGLPNASASERIGLIRDIAAGNLSGGLSGAVPHAVLKALAMHSFGDGYRAILLAAAAFAALSAVLSWRLIRSTEPLAGLKRRQFEPPA